MANVLDTITLDFRRIWQLTLEQSGGFLVCAIGGGAGNSASPFFMSDADASNDFVHLNYATSLPSGAPEVGSIVQVHFMFSGSAFSPANRYQPAEWIGRIFTYVLNAYDVPYAVVENVNTGEWIIALIEELETMTPPTEAMLAVTASILKDTGALPTFGPLGHKKPKHVHP